ncbi:mechanosensitive ion channel family protein [Bombella saccharophila]|uniref:Mechanosensitive ion channel n=1 Tax=Bombella saccharophila TaxID=2967338 RepID=A0ABT3WAZ6_9PROT|nr:mechanosensitive ion channel domain-containing protein [Bombella saccharophila]MCX5614803.1 mechanosensitive ion channel [Bombella saccharophila]
MMRHFVQPIRVAIGAFLGLAFILASPVHAAAPAATPADKAVDNPPSLVMAQAEGDFGWNNVAVALRAQLEQDQATLRAVSTGLGHAKAPLSGSALDVYSAQVRVVRQHVTDGLAQIQSYEGSINSLLQVLGNKTEDGEDAAITRQRGAARKTSLGIASLQVRMRVCDLQTRQLESQLDGLRRRVQQGALIRHVETPLSLGFWQNIGAEGYTALKNLTRSELNILIGTLGVMGLVFVCEEGLRWLAGRTLNAALSRVRWATAIRTQRALGSVLLGILCALLAEVLWQGWEMVAFGFEGIPFLAGQYLTQSLPVFGFVIGAGVSLRRWLRGKVCPLCSLLLGVGVLCCGALRTAELNKSLGPGLDAVLEGSLALSSAILLYVPCRVDKKRQQNAGDEVGDLGGGVAQDIGGILMQYFPIHGISALLLVVTGLAVLSGYISFAFLLNDWVLTLLYAFGVVMLLMQAWRDSAQFAFSAQSHLGRIWNELGLSARRLAQMEVVSTALVGLGLVMVFLALLQGRNGASFSGAWQGLQQIFAGDIFFGIPFSPRMLVNSALLLVGVFYAIKFLQQWLQNRLFPVTSLDNGAQTSIISIMTYTLWIVAGLKLLSMMGISVQNLTWVVSALSVGVGFGLQSIVKDFISGLILLAERPAQAGDKISISGTTGVIQRVNVRATDIRLSDGTMVIMPNSQFITSNVQNWSAGQNPIKVKLVVAVPSNVSLDKVQEIFMQVANEQPNILRDPAPQILLDSNAGQTVGATLAVYIARGTSSDAVTTSVMGALMDRFNQEGISLILPS